MSNPNEFNSAYFANIMEEANKNGIDPIIMEEQKEALEFADKRYLKMLSEASPSEFYGVLINCFGSAMLNRASDINAIKKARTTVDSLGEKLKTKPAFVMWFYKAIKFVAATIIGVVKFAWDTTLVTGAFAGRFGYRLLKNVGKALWNTCKETKEDAVNAGHTIGNSFRKNVVATVPKVEKIQPVTA